MGLSSACADTMTRFDSGRQMPLNEVHGRAPHLARPRFIA